MYNNTGDVMFGYVYVNKNALSKEAQETYQAYYCGLCKSLKQFGACSRLTLNFDMAFLALFLDAYKNKKSKQICGKCAIHPKKPCLYFKNKNLLYAAKMNILLTYYKFDDDVHDDKSAFAYCAKKVLQKNTEEIKKEYPHKVSVICDALKELKEYEKVDLHDFNKCADTFGRILGQIFDKENNDKKLYDFGFSLGRAIYVLDACVDLKQDIKKERFNPMVEIPSREFQQILTIMLSETTNIYGTMDITINNDIIENVLYSGIWERFEISKKNKKEKK